MFFYEGKLGEVQLRIGGKPVSFKAAKVVAPPLAMLFFYVFTWSE